MHDLIAITPMGGQAPRTDTHAGVTLTEVCTVALASVAARAGQVQATFALITDQIGTQPPAPGRHAGTQAGAQAGTGMQAFWISPDMWMIEAPLEQYDDLAAHLTGLAAGCASITEQTDAWCRFDLSGPNLSAVCALLCPVDLRGMAEGHATGLATRTTIDHLGGFLICRSATDLTIYGPRSGAVSLHHALETAMRAAL
ncbi:MAG: sarcosine oxidase subunit gamma [Paracoccaceae bacterium]